MGEEQRQILQMVADGKVSADEGARLLEALEKGQRRRRDLDSPARMAREKKRIIRERIRDGETGGFEGLRDIGRMVRSMIRDSIPGMDEDELPDELEEPVDGDFKPLDGPLELEEGTRLRISRTPVRNSAGSLLVSGNDGSSLEIVGDESPEVRVSTERDTVYLVWSTGDLHLSVPQTVEELTVKILGGDIIINDLSASTRLKTKGGDIGLYDVTGDFSAKTMGGNVMIRLGEGWSEDSKASTMGGSISLEVRESTGARITARTMGGDINVGEGLSAERRSGHTGSSAVSIDLSDGEDGPELKLKTMGGDISMVVFEEETSKDDAGKKRRGKK